MVLTALTGELMVPRAPVILPQDNVNKSLVAGRIWWLAGKAKLILDTGLLRRYSATITILYVYCTPPNTFAKRRTSVESGVIYSLYIILVLGFWRHSVAHVSPFPVARVFGSPISARLYLAAV